MLNRSPPNLAAAAATDAPPEQPFRFLDLPKELRLLVFEELMDNPKDAIKFTTPRNLEVEEVHLDGMHYPSVLQVSKLVYDEYWSLCFRESVLWIIYGFDESAPTDEENNVDQKPTIPRLSEWVVMPIEALERVTEVFFKFKADWMLPNIDPFSGIAPCVAELSSLRVAGIWSEVDMAVIERGGSRAERVKRFRNFVERFFLEQAALLDLKDDEGRDLSVSADLNVFTPLFEMNKNYHWPRRRHLQQGVAPLVDLPEWGYSMYQVAVPSRRRLANSFKYYGEKLTFLRVEYNLPVLERMHTECDSPSEIDYEFDESGWATGIMPD